MHMRTLPELEDGQWWKYLQEIWTLQRLASFQPKFVQNADFTLPTVPYYLIKRDFQRDSKEPSSIEKRPFPTAFFISSTKNRNKSIQKKKKGTIAKIMVFLKKFDFTLNSLLDRGKKAILFYYTCLMAAHCIENSAYIVQPRECE